MWGVCEHLEGSAQGFSLFCCSKLWMMGMYSRPRLKISSVCLSRHAADVHGRIVYISRSLSRGLKLICGYVGTEHNLLFCLWHQSVFMACGVMILLLVWWVCVCVLQVTPCVCWVRRRRKASVWEERGWICPRSGRTRWLKSFPSTQGKMWTNTHSWKIQSHWRIQFPAERSSHWSRVGVDRYVFFRADTDTDYYRSSRPITDILNRYTCLV